MPYEIRLIKGLKSWPLYYSKGSAELAIREAKRTLFKVALHGLRNDKQESGTTC